SIENTNAGDLAELMVGRALPETAKRERPEDKSPDSCLVLKGISRGLLQNVSLRVRRGEIVGLAGVDGNGQSELLEVLSSLSTPDTGTFHVADPETKTSDSGLSIIPADRQHVGLITSFSLFENLALHPALRAACKNRFGFDWEVAKHRTRELMQK